MFEEWAANRRRIVPILNGSEARFLRINKQVGIKIYSTKESRDFAVQKQRQFSKYGLGPAVYGQFMVSAETLQRIPKWNSETFTAQSQYYTYITQAANMTKPWPEEIAEFERKLEETFPNDEFCTGDFRDGNFGRIKRKLVLIDFGMLTLEGTDGGTISCDVHDSSWYWYSN